MDRTVWCARFVNKGLFPSFCWLEAIDADGRIGSALNYSQNKLQIPSMYLTSRKEYWNILSTNFILEFNVKYTWTGCFILTNFLKNLINEDRLISVLLKTYHLWIYNLDTALRGISLKTCSRNCFNVSLHCKVGLDIWPLCILKNLSCTQIHSHCINCWGCNLTCRIRFDFDITHVHHRPQRETSLTL